MKQVLFPLKPSKNHRHRSLREYVFKVNNISIVIKVVNNQSLDILLLSSWLILKVHFGVLAVRDIFNQNLHSEIATSFLIGLKIRIAVFHESCLSATTIRTANLVCVLQQYGDLNHIRGNCSDIFIVDFQQIFAYSWVKLFSHFYINFPTPCPLKNKLSTLGKPSQWQHLDYSKILLKLGFFSTESKVKH